MSVGYADDIEEEQPPEAGGSVDESVLSRQGSLADAPAVPDLNPEDTQQGAPGASEPHTLDAAGSTPAPATDAFPPAPQFPELGPPPPPPVPTGDPQKDVAANLLWQRALTEHHGELTKRQTALAKYAADVGAMKGKKEAEVAQVEATQKAAEVKRAAEDRIARQAAVDAAVRERVEAAKDVEGITWDKSRPRTGSEIAAIILGGVAASLSNTARIQVGQAPTAENEAVKAIDARMKREFEAKKHRYAAAGDAVLMAKYQVTTADQAHRAAMNDINADMAAKYRLIAKQAEDATLQAGGTLAQAKGNLVSVDALQKAAVHEGDIANREEGHADQRRQAAATLKLAQASLGERRSEHRDTLDEKKREFDLRKAEAEAKKAEKDLAAKEKAEKDLEARTIRDPETDEPLRIAPTARGVDKVVQQQTAARAYSQGLRELADDIEKNGRVGSDLPIIGTEAGKRRIELHSNVVARGRKALDLGVSNANLQLEHGAVGGSGAGLSRIGSPDVLRKIADDNDKFAAQRLRSGTAPIKGAKPAAAPAAPAEAPAKPPKTVIDQAWKAIDDKKASPALRQKAVDVLTSAGLL